jgi:hypothetical protein
VNAIPERYPATGADLAVSITRRGTHHRIGLRLSFDGLLDVERLRRAVRLSFDAEPVLATALVLVQAAGKSGFAAIYALIVGLATLTAAIPYAFCSLARTLIAAREGRLASTHVSPVEIVAFIFSMFVIYGCGPEAVLYGLVMLLLGIPVYVWERRKQLSLAPAEHAAVTGSRGGGLK